MGGVNQVDCSAPERVSRRHGAYQMENEFVHTLWRVEREPSPAGMGVYLAAPHSQEHGAPFIQFGKAPTDQHPPLDQHATRVSRTLDAKSYAMVLEVEAQAKPR
jgi:hypothetical protein